MLCVPAHSLVKRLTLSWAYIPAENLGYGGDVPGVTAVLARDWLRYLLTEIFGAMPKSRN